MTYVDWPEVNPFAPTADWWNVYVKGDIEAGLLVPIASSGDLAAATASVTFSSLPTQYAHLFYIACCRSDTAALLTNLSCRFNGDAGANYDAQVLWGELATPSAAELRAQTQAYLSNIAGNTAAALCFGGQLGWIFDYNGTTFHKHVRNQVAVKTGASAGHRALANTSKWRSTAAINSITFLATAGNLMTSSRIDLYGVGRS